MKLGRYHSLVAILLMMVSLSGCFSGLFAWPLWFVGFGIGSVGASGMLFSDPQRHPNVFSANLGVCLTGVFLGQESNGRVDGLNTLPIETDPEILAEFGITTDQIISYNRYLANNTENLHRVAKEVVKDINSLNHLKTMTASGFISDPIADKIAKKYGFKNVSDYLESFTRDKLPLEFRLNFARLYNIDPNMTQVFLVHALGIKTN
jgi:hypothetical protein